MCVWCVCLGCLCVCADVIRSDHTSNITAVHSIGTDLAHPRHGRLVRYALFLFILYLVWNVEFFFPLPNPPFWLLLFLFCFPSSTRCECHVVASDCLIDSSSVLLLCTVHFFYLTTLSLAHSLPYWKDERDGKVDQLIVGLNNCRRERFVSGSSVIPYRSHDPFLFNSVLSISQRLHGLHRFAFVLNALRQCRLTYLPISFIFVWKKRKKRYFSLLPKKIFVFLFFSHWSILSEQVFRRIYYTLYISGCVCVCTCSHVGHERSRKLWANNSWTASLAYRRASRPGSTE